MKVIGKEHTPCMMAAVFFCLFFFLVVDYTL